MQAYEGLETAKTLREEYVFIPAKVRELYLAHLLETLEEHKIRRVSPSPANPPHSSHDGCHTLWQEFALPHMCSLRRP